MTQKKQPIKPRMLIKTPTNFVLPDNDTESEKSMYSGSIILEISYTNCVGISGNINIITNCFKTCFEC